jgi:fucose 4-O-acetylase-like acetyltransferase
MEQGGSATASHRDSRIDALRGLAIALVVLRHAIPWTQHVDPFGFGPVLSYDPWWIPGLLRQPNSASYAGALTVTMNVYAPFFVTLFGFLSGYVLFGKDDGIRLLSGRFVRLIVPYFSWVLLTYALYNRFVMPVSDLPKALLGMSIPGGLGYFYELFLATCIFVAVRKVSKKTSVLLVTALAAAVLGRIALAGGAWAAAIARSIGMYSFVALGYIWAAKRVWLSAHRRGTLWLGLAAYPALLALIWPPLGGSSWLERTATTLAQNGGLPGGYALKTLCVAVVTPLVHLGAAMAAIAVLFVLYEALPASIARPQAALGKRTLGVYAIHIPVLFLTIQVLGIRDLIVASALAVGGSYLLAGLIDRVPVARYLLLGASPARRRQARRSS